MRLSVILPAYNAEDCISGMLTDLLAQQVPDMEILVINDGSTDNTAEVLESFREPFQGRLRVLNVSNGGQGRARNFALREAKGDYIGFVDADDRCSPEFFSKMLRKAEEEDADIVQCDFLRVYPDGFTRYEPAALQENPLSSAGAVWNKIYRRKTIGGVRFAEGLWYEDLLFSAKMLLKSAKSAYLPEALYYYQVGHTSTMTNQNAKKNLDIIKIMEDLRQYAARDYKEADLDFLIINHVLLESCKRVYAQSSEDKKEVLSKLNDYVHQRIPNLTENKAYQAETRNRRIIMKLLYDGHYFMADTILKLKS